MNAPGMVRRLAEVAHKLQGALGALERDGRIDETTDWSAIRDRVDLACWVFGPAAVDGERRAELRAVIEAAERLGEIDDEARGAPQ